VLLVNNSKVQKTWQDIQLMKVVAKSPRGHNLQLICKLSSSKHKYVKSIKA